MFYFLNKHSVLQIVLMVPLICWTVLTVFTKMCILPADGQSFLYQAICPYLSTHLVLMKLLACLLIVAVVLLLQGYYSVCKFSENQTFMPVFVALLFLNAGHFITQFNPALFTLFFFALINFTNAKVEMDKPIQNRVYSSGIWIALATLFDPQAIWIALFMVFSLIANRVSKSKEIVIMLLGILLVYVYLFISFFMTDRLPEMLAVFHQLQFFALIHQFTALAPLQYVVLATVLLVLLMSCVVVKIYYDNKLIVLRKRYVTVLLMAFVACVSIVFSGLDYKSSLVYMLIPYGLLFSMLSLVKRKKYVYDFFLVALFVLLWL